MTVATRVANYIRGAGHHNGLIRSSKAARLQRDHSSFPTIPSGDRFWPCRLIVKLKLGLPSSFSGSSGGFEVSRKNIICSNHRKPPPLNLSSLPVNRAEETTFKSFQIPGQGKKVVALRVQTLFGLYKNSDQANGCLALVW